jgi:hypothetical protein
MRYVLAVLIVLFSVPAFAATATLTWGDNSTNETNFDVERKAELCAGTVGTWAVIGTTAANIVTYRDATIVEGASYCYRVNARNSAGKSGYSNTAGATVPFSIPAVPGQLGITIEP